MSIATAEEKAALLLKCLPSEVADSVLAQLDAEHGERLRALLQRLGESTQTEEEIEQVLREFQAFLETAPDKAAPARPAEEDQAAGRSLPEPDALANAVATLRELSPQQLAQALQGEGLHTICLVLNCLEANAAGDVLKSLPAEVRREASLRLGGALPANPELLQTVARAVLRKLALLQENPEAASAEAKVRRLSDMLRRLERADRIEILNALDESDPETAAKLKEMLYRFEDLQFLEDRSMQRLLSEFDSKNLASALKGAADPIKEKVMNNLSKRAREALSEEIEFLGTLPTALVQQAQKLVVEAMQRLDQAGELVMLEQ